MCPNSNINNGIYFISSTHPMIFYNWRSRKNKGFDECFVNFENGEYLVSFGNVR